MGPRHAALRPDAPRRRVRPAARGQRPRPGGGRRPRRRRRGAREGGRCRRGGRVAPGGRPQGREDRHRRRPTAASPSRRSRTRRWRPAAPATSSPARSARCSPRASRRSTPRGSGVYLHGLAGELVRERIGDAGLLAGDLPDALADRAASGWRRSRSGSGAVAGSASGRARTTRQPAPPRAHPDRSRRLTPRRRRDPLTRRPAVAAIRVRRGSPSRRAWRAPACRRCRAPRGWSSTSTRSRGNLAAMRGRPSARVSASSPSSRPTPTATARCRWPSRSRRRAPTGCRSRPSTRRSSSATAGVRAPGPRPVSRCPPARSRRPRPGGDRRDGGRRSRSWSGPRGGGGGRRGRRAATLVVHLEVETGLGRGGVLPDEATARWPTPSRRRPGVRLARRVDAPRRTRRRRERARARTRGSSDARSLVLGTRRRRVGRRSDTSPAAAGSSADGWPAGTPSARASPPTGSCRTRSPADADARRRRATPCARSSRSTRGRCGSSTLPAGHGVSYGPVVRHRAAVADRHPAPRLRRRLAPGMVRPGRGARARHAGAARRAGGDGRRDGRRHGRPGRPGHRGRRVRAHRRAGDERITALDLAATAERSATRWSPAMSRRLPRVYHAAGSPVGIRYLAGGRAEWHASSSGTGTSATSRSTPS